ncbi:hypothetical protein CDG81_15395 [Actinopolyspora erythraea]|uniref:Uncharacterized protein n=1 Tax=Actinopolyspora erythraea TaxID=414996 RepID=A0A099D438_9ACTN|nr:hypothetical protein [Actinopolyspora erythraea]ASU79436.1 hypothetical protein CDG81_15395 [Actinopolyspora erythraea]KGI80943.1 hypothetical protein IL38_14360 [Actinopolyspora erythraea]
MRNAMTLYRVVNPDSLGSYTELLHHQPTEHRVDDAEAWPRLREWALAVLDRTEERFGMYQIALMPLNARGQPDENAFHDLIADDTEVIEDYLCWSGCSELVPAPGR